MKLFTENHLHVPRPFQVFGISEVEHVFRLMQSGLSAGKFAIEMRKGNVIQVCAQKP